MYDEIAQGYREIVRDVTMPLHIAELYTFALMIGDVRGKTVLDLGCGEGFYSRRLLDLGAARVVGIDISPGMVALAQGAVDAGETATSGTATSGSATSGTATSGSATSVTGTSETGTSETATRETGTSGTIEYRVADVRTAGRMGEFDLVTSFFMLNHALDRDDLLAMCRGIAANLKPGGRFFAFNNNLDMPPAAYPLIEKYGRSQQAPEPLVEGTPITITIRRGEEDCTFVDCYLSRATYAWALAAAGLQNATWRSPQVPPAELAGEGQAYWQDFLDYPTFVVIEAAAPAAAPTLP